MLFAICSCFERKVALKMRIARQYRKVFWVMFSCLLPFHAVNNVDTGKVINRIFSFSLLAEEDYIDKHCTNCCVATMVMKNQFFLEKEVILHAVIASKIKAV